MNTNSKLYYIHCLTPVHVGTGEGTGIIDMPIMREKVTAWPLIPGSSIKGVERDYFQNSGVQNKEWIEAAFGREETSDNPGHAGALVMSDARLLSFPVASRYGTFAYVSSPLAIQRMMRDTMAVGIEMPSVDWDRLDVSLQAERVIVGSDSVIGGKKESKGEVKVIVELDEFSSVATVDEALQEWVEWISGQLFADRMSQKLFKQRFVVVSDEAFQYFVTTCCEITPRIRISNETKTVQRGALWYEEYIPTESILYGLVWSDKVHVRGSNLTAGKLLSRMSGEQLLQIGANATVGKGRVRCRYSEGEQI